MHNHMICHRQRRRQRQLGVVALNDVIMNPFEQGLNNTTCMVATNHLSTRLDCSSITNISSSSIMSMAVKNHLNNRSMVGPPPITTTPTTGPMKYQYRHHPLLPLRTGMNRLGSSTTNSIINITNINLQFMFNHRRRRREHQRYRLHLCGSNRSTSKPTIPHRLLGPDPRCRQEQLRGPGKRPCFPRLSSDLHLSLSITRYRTLTRRRHLAQPSP